MEVSGQIHASAALPPGKQPLVYMDDHNIPCFMETESGSPSSH
jgi:hypothetical protein